MRWCGDRVRTVSRVRFPTPPRVGGGLLLLLRRLRAPAPRNANSPRHHRVHVERQHLTETRVGGSTRDPIERALTDDDPEAVPRLAPTRLPHSDPRQIRVLLLCFCRY